MTNDDALLELTAVERNSFPKQCPTCGAMYQNVEEYIAKTQGIGSNQGLKLSEGDEGEVILELFRNCVCGSTLLDFFADRRNGSEQGEKRRRAFDKIVGRLVGLGVDQQKAITELRAYLKTKKSQLFDDLKLFKK